MPSAVLPALITIRCKITLKHVSMLCSFQRLFLEIETMSASRDLGYSLRCYCKRVSGQHSSGLLRCGMPTENARPAFIFMCEIIEICSNPFMNLGLLTIPKIDICKNKSPNREMWKGWWTISWELSVAMLISTPSLLCLGQMRIAFYMEKLCGQLDVCVAAVGSGEGNSVYVGHILRQEI